MRRFSELLFVRLTSSVDLNFIIRITLYIAYSTDLEQIQ